MAFKEWFMAEGEYQWDEGDPYGTAEMIWNASAQVHTAAEREKHPHAELRALADGPCSCTLEQQTGRDYTVCLACTASGMLNGLGEIYENMLEEARQLQAIKEADDDPR